MTYVAFKVYSLDGRPLAPTGGQTATCCCISRDPSRLRSPTRLNMVCAGGTFLSVPSLTIDTSLDLITGPHICPYLYSLYVHTSYVQIVPKCCDGGCVPGWHCMPSDAKHNDKLLANKSIRPLHRLLFVIISEESAADINTRVC